MLRFLCVLCMDHVKEVLYCHVLLGASSLWVNFDKSPRDTAIRIDCVNNLVTRLQQGIIFRNPPVPIVASHLLNPLQFLSIFRFVENFHILPSFLLHRRLEFCVKSNFLLSSHFFPFTNNILVRGLF